MLQLNNLIEVIACVKILFFHFGKCGAEGSIVRGSIVGNCLTGSLWQRPTTQIPLHSRSPEDTQTTPINVCRRLQFESGNLCEELESEIYIVDDELFGLDAFSHTAVYFYQWAKTIVHSR